MTMRRSKLCLLLLATLMMVVLGGLTSCNSKKEQKGPQPTEFEMSMTNQDSIDVRNLVDQFFTLVKNKDYAGATEMLYRIDPQNPKEKPEPLSNDEIAKMMGMLKSVPMESYKIEYIKFNESYANEVLCNVTIKKGNGKDIPDITTKMFFKPMRWLGQWCLGVMDSDHGDRSVIDPLKRDSMQKEYSAEMKAKKAEEKQH